MEGREKEKPDHAKKSGKRREVLFGTGAAVAAVGLLLIQLFVLPEMLTGLSFLHLLQIAFTLLASVCAVGLAWSAMKTVRKKKTGSTS